MNDKSKEIERLKQHLSVGEPLMYYTKTEKSNNKGFISIILISLIVIISLIITILLVK